MPTNMNFFFLSVLKLKTEESKQTSGGPKEIFLLLVQCILSQTDARQSHNDKYRATLFNGEQEWHNNRKLSFIWGTQTVRRDARRERAMQIIRIAAQHQQKKCFFFHPF